MRVFAITVFMFVLAQFAMGEAFVADFLSADCDMISVGFGGSSFIEGGATSVFGNPAMANISGPRFYASHEGLYGNLLVSDALGGTIRTPRGNLALTALYLGGGGIDVTALPDPDAPVGPNNRPYSTETKGHHDLALGGAFAIPINRNISIGLSAGGMFRALIDETAFGGFASAGLDWEAKPNLHLGFVAANISAGSWSTGTNEFGPPDLRVGGNYRVNLGSGFVGRITSEVALVTSAKYLEYSAGAEVSYRSIVAFRAGTDNGAVSAGADFSVFKGITVGAALTTHSELPISYRFGINVYAPEPSDA